MSPTASWEMVKTVNLDVNFTAMKIILKRHEEGGNEMSLSYMADEKCEGQCLRAGRAMLGRTRMSTAFNSTHIHTAFHC